jgi:hypothetical protein
MQVGFSYWGFCEKFNDCNVSNTPDGHRYGRPIFVDALIEKGHNVYALQQKRESFCYPGLVYAEGHFPEIDVLFIEWRWPTYKNSGPAPQEPDLKRQIELLDYYCGKIPVVVWDTDLKITEEDELRWPNMIVTDPSYETNVLTRKRVHVPFWSDFKSLFDACNYSYNYTYVGNNYEREKAFKKYYGMPSDSLRGHGVQTIAYGNWLQRSPERNDPDMLLRSCDKISFGRRYSFRESMKILNESLCTAHISKDLYYKLGFASPRYLENIICNVPAFVPEEFKFNKILGEYWTVRNSDDVVKKILKIKELNSKQREEIVMEQKYNLLQHYNFNVENVVSFLESL